MSAQRDNSRGDPSSDRSPDPVARAILDCLAAEPPGRSLGPEQVARLIAQERARPKQGDRADPQAWRRYFRAVKDQAMHLARNGRIELVRKGAAVPVDELRDLKGVWRMRLPGA